MANNQVTKNPMPTALSPKTEPGHWLLWILASITANTVVGNHAFRISYWLDPILPDRFSFQFDPIVGGIIGGVIAGIGVGFMPWLAQKYPVSRVGWWAYTLASIVITVIAVVIAYLTIFDYGILPYIIIFVVPFAGVSSIIALATRRIGQRWLESKVQTLEWVLAGILILIIAFAMLSYTVWLFSKL